MAKNFNLFGSLEPLFELKLAVLGPATVEPHLTATLVIIGHLIIMAIFFLSWKDGHTFSLKENPVNVVTR